MLPPIKLNSIDQEHLQELYDSSGVARDELPYSDAFETLWQGFQDRTFKNAEREQLFGAIIKYVRSSSNASKEVPPGDLTDEQIKQLKQLLPKQAKAGKILPYSEEFSAAKADFQKLISAELSDQDFWRAIIRTQGAKRRPPKRTKPVREETAESDDGVE